MIELLPNFHPVLVHFSIALLLVSLFAFLVSIWGGNYTVRYQARLIGRWNLWIGATLSILTVAAGVYAYFTVAHDTPSHIVMTKHRNIALVTFALYAMLAIWSMIHFRKDKDESKGFVLTLVAAAVLMLVTAWYGGELVYRYGLGVLSLPQAEGPGHSHDHGDGLGHESEAGRAMPEGESAPHDHTDEAGNDGHGHSHDVEGQ